MSDSEPSTDELRARFTEPPTALPQTLPLLSSTPPTVSKALLKAYPYLLIVNKGLLVITWTNDDYWVNVVLMCSYTLGVLYFETLVTWLGHLVVVLVVCLYLVLNTTIVRETSLKPTLDDVVQALTTTCTKADMLLAPVLEMGLTPYDIKRLLFTTVFLTPLYLFASFLIVSPRMLLLHLGLFVLSYHLAYLRMARKLLWRLKVARLACFYLTGLDFSHARNSSLFAAAFAKVQKSPGPGQPALKPVRFTYVIFENQRRWLGIGWTSNLLTYERAPWTDEFLNESSLIETFELPNADENFNAQGISGARWRWVDKTWRLDLTNDGAITLPSSQRSKTTVKPTNDEGFLYTDNVWKKPTTDDSYAKYTRRRRWIRTAELVFPLTDTEAYSTSVESKRKSLRFADDTSSTKED